MKCTLCGAELAENSVFCTQCGSRITQPQPRCIGCGNPMQPGAKFCSVCGTAVQAAAPVRQAAPISRFPEETIPTPRKKSKLPLILGILSIVAVVGIVVAGFLTNWFGLTGSDKDEAGGFIFHENFTVDFDIRTESEKYGGNAQIAFNKRHDEVTALLEMELDGIDTTVAIYDGDLIIWDGENQSGFCSDMYQSAISGFTLLFWLGDEDEEDICEFYENFLATLIMSYLNVWDLETIADTDAYEEAIQTLVQTFATPDWKEEYLGYEVTKSGKTTTHSIDTNLYTVINGVLPFFEDCLEGDFYKTISDSIKEAKTELCTITLKAEFGIRSGKLCTVNGEFTAEDESIRIELEITNGGKTEIDIDQIEDILERIENASAHEPVATGAAEYPAA